MKRGGLLSIQIFILLIGILLITAGVFREEPAVVLGKAVQICLECIGIG
jgi:hypothetical protein